MTGRTLCKAVLVFSAGFCARLLGEYIWEHDASSSGGCGFVLAFLLGLAFFWDDMWPPL